MPEPSFLLRLACRNQPGIVSAISTALYEGGFNILDAQQFDDLESSQFFSRVTFNAGSGERTVKAVERLIAPAVDRFAMSVTVRDRSVRRRVLLMVSKFDHCLVDLLYRVRTGELPMDVVAIVANYPAETYDHIDFGDAAFHYLPVTPETKARQEQALLDIIDSSGAELVVLARYMQILSGEFSARYEHRIINIHHSFLPAFIGGKPYHRAHERGVKLIGATAHYATSELDEGPIIEQDVIRASHRDSVEDLIRKGRDVEKAALARAVKWHVEDRVLVYGNKTVVFE
jgi:formyltetrahydrofolate deformylase